MKNNSERLIVAVVENLNPGTITAEPKAASTKPGHKTAEDLLNDAQRIINEQAEYIDKLNARYEAERAERERLDAEILEQRQFINTLIGKLDKAESKLERMKARRR